MDECELHDWTPVAKSNSGLAFEECRVCGARRLAGGTNEAKRRRSA